MIIIEANNTENKRFSMLIEQTYKEFLRLFTGNKEKKIKDLFGV